jgi:hypothetical protein
MLYAGNPQYGAQSSSNPQFGSAQPAYQSEGYQGGPSPIPNQGWDEEYGQRSKRPFFILLFVVAAAVGAGLYFGTDIITGPAKTDSPDLGGAGPTPDGALPGLGETVGDFNIKSQIVGDAITFELLVQQNVGWMSLSFDGGHGAVDSVHCSFTGGATGTVYDTFSTADGGTVAHSLDTAASNVVLDSSSQTATQTTCRFTRPLVTGDLGDVTPDKDLAAGAAQAVAVAYGTGPITPGAAGAVMTYSIHTVKTTGSITLPQPTVTPPAPDGGGGGLPGAGEIIGEFTFKSSVTGDSVTMEVSTPKSVGWLALGFDGGHGAVDSIHCSFGGPTVATVFDSFTTGNNRVAHSLDSAASNVVLVSAAQSDTLTRCTFSRPLTTGDAADASPDKVLTAGGQLAVALAYGDGAITPAGPGQLLGYTIHTVKTSGAVNLAAAGAVTATQSPVPSPPANAIIGLTYTVEPNPAISAAVKASFARAAAFWNNVITNDLAPVAGAALGTGCNGGGFILPGTVNGIQIGLSIVPIDGPGKILGSAGPCAGEVKDNKLRARAGVMRFDDADVAKLLADGQFDDVARHEMGHVLGMGTLWGQNGLIQDGAAPALDHRYLGANGNIGYQQITGVAGQAQIENQGGEGTAKGHFREATFQNELMTGFLNAGIVNPLSVMSVQSLKDLGYTVDVAKAEAYTLPTAGVTRGSAEMDMAGDILDFGLTMENARRLRGVEPEA